MKITLAVFFAVFCSCSLSAQETPKAEIFAGYSYMNFGTESISDRLNLNGWEASAAFNLNRWVGVEADFSGHYKGNCWGAPGVTCKHLSFMGGPRFTYRQGRVTAFAHGLFGGDNGSLSYSGFSTSDTPFALAAGGGMDIALTNHISIRAVQVDYVMTRHFSNYDEPHQDNIRASAGIVFTVGGRREMRARKANQTGGVAVQTVPSREPAPPPAPTTQIQPAAVSVALSLGVTGSKTEDGFRVTSVRGGSPASQMFLRVGDVISKIDGKGVTSGEEIDAAVGASTIGVVKVTGLTQTAVGMVQFERETKVR